MNNSVINYSRYNITSTSQFDDGLIELKSIFGSSFSDPQRTYPITAREERFIIELVQDYDVKIQDAYIETEVDEFGDTYESMFVSVISDDYSTIKLLESDFYELENMFGILFDCEFNGFGRCGKTYEFYHYFI